MLRRTDLIVIFCGAEWPAERRGKTARAERSQRLAQANSTARMANPAGIIMNAGPGSTTIATPRASTVPPAIMIMMRLKRFIAFQVFHSDRRIATG